jgi:hypothetical protein
VTVDDAVMRHCEQSVDDTATPLQVVDRAGRGLIVQLTPCTAHPSGEPFAPRSGVEWWRRYLSHRREYGARALPQLAERLSCLATASQWARVDRSPRNRFREVLPDGCCLRCAERIEAGIGIVAPGSRGLGVSHQKDSRHARAAPTSAASADSCCAEPCSAGCVAAPAVLSSPAASCPALVWCQRAARLRSADPWR